ncbi:UNVERIFIED_ORG: hypothetical protein BDK47_11857 [Anoxybacillus amylolyticus]
MFQKIKTCYEDVRCVQKVLAFVVSRLCIIALFVVFLYVLRVVFLS